MGCQGEGRALRSYWLAVRKGGGVGQRGGTPVRPNPHPESACVDSRWGIFGLRSSWLEIAVLDEDDAEPVEEPTLDVFVEQQGRVGV